MVLGDSFVRHIQGWEVTKKLGNKQKVYVRQVAGSKVKCICDYAKPCIRKDNPDHIIFHVETNDILLSKNLEAIKITGVTIPSIIPRNCQYYVVERVCNKSILHFLLESGT